VILAIGPQKSQHAAAALLRHASYTIPDSLKQRCAFSKTVVDLYELYLRGSAQDGDDRSYFDSGLSGLQTLVTDCESSLSWDTFIGQLRRHRASERLFDGLHALEASNHRPSGYANTLH